MSDIVWEDPPAAALTRGHTPWERRLLPLMEHPNRWARVHAYDLRSSARTVTRQLQARKLRVPEGEWEFACANADDGRPYVYARYLGENGASS